MTGEEFRQVVIATMQYVRMTDNVRSIPNFEIIQNVKRIISNELNKEE